MTGGDSAFKCLSATVKAILQDLNISGQQYEYKLYNDGAVRICVNGGVVFIPSSGIIDEAIENSLCSVGLRKNYSFSCVFGECHLRCGISCA